jgi:phosphohistidine swiveling domain-containing protein
VENPKDRTIAAAVWTDRADKAWLRQGHRQTKAAGLQMVEAAGLRTPTTFVVCPGNSPALDRACSAVLAGGPPWIARADAPPEVRFSLRDGLIPMSSARDYLSQLVERLPSAACSIVVQRHLTKRLAGVAIGTIDGGVVVEVQSETAGNFVRDGSTPRRWVLGPDRAVVSGNSELPDVVASSLFDSFHKIGQRCCLEWVLDKDDGWVYFVDAKPVQSGYLQSFTEVSEACIPLVYGQAVGIACGLSEAVAPGTPLLLIADRTSVSQIPRMSSDVLGIVFHCGGILSHAAIYASLLGVPMVLCKEHMQIQPGALMKLVVKPDAHFLEVSN